MLIFKLVVRVLVFERRFGEMISDDDDDYAARCEADALSRESPRETGGMASGRAGPGLRIRRLASGRAGPQNSEIGVGPGRAGPQISLFNFKKIAISK